MAHLSDLHFGSEIPSIADALLDSLDELSPDVVVISGDFTMAGRRSEYRSAAEFINRIKAPVVATPGNHDIPVYSLWERFSDPFGRYHEWISPAAYTKYTSSSVALIAVTSARPWDLSFNWSHGRLSSAQARRVDRFLEANQDVPFRAVVVHHPFCVPDDMPGFKTIRNAGPMLDVLARHGVSAVLAGHLHRSFTASRKVLIEHEDRAVPIVQASTSTSSRHRDQPNAFNIMEIEGSEFEVHEYIYDGSQFSLGEVSHSSAICEM